MRGFARERGGDGWREGRSQTDGERGEVDFDFFSFRLERYKFAERKEEMKELCKPASLRVELSNRSQGIERGRRPADLDASVRLCSSFQSALEPERLFIRAYIIRAGL